MTPRGARALAAVGDDVITVPDKEYAEGLLSCLPDLVFVIDGAGQLVFASGTSERLLGWKADAWIGRSAMELVHPDDLDMALVSLESVGAKVVGSPIDVRVATADGGWRHLEIVGTNHLDDPSVQGIVIAARDVTERRRFEIATNEYERFRSLVHNSAAITMLVDQRGVIASLSGAFARILGHDPERVIGTQLSEWVVPNQRARVEATFMDAVRSLGTTTFDATLAHRDRPRTVPLEFSVVNLLDDPVVEGLVVTAYDITPLREAQASLAHLATHDALTGLANRNLLLERIEDALARGRVGSPVTVFFADLDRFKPINDLLGHGAGDQLLVTVAGRLRDVARDQDTVARLGGDEFVVVTEHVTSLADAQAIAQRIERAVAEPVTLGAGPTRVFASVGFARSDPGSTAESLLAEADGAMYLVKAERHGDVRRTVVRISERRALAEGLAIALRDDQLRVHYQPIVALAQDRITGFEALVRWKHPERGLLHPRDFLGVAEESGLDLPLGETVLRLAVEQLAEWRRERPDLTVAINISASQLADPSVPATVADVIRAAGVDPGAVCLEISERTMLEGATRGTAKPAAASLVALKEVGVKLAIDDFGTGYSSLTHVRQFPVDILKIDRSFVTGLNQSTSDTSIVQAVCGLARAMGMRAIAEGVERPDQASALLAMSCDLAQGYLYGRPAPADQLAGLLARHSDGTVRSITSRRPA